MAATHHVRSNSFPSRPHPQSALVEDHLIRLRSSEAASTSSSFSICQRLNGLQDLYASIYDMLQLPFTQQSLAQEKNKESIEQILDGSLRLLEVCNIAKDALSQTKEGLNEIQSILRRKRGDLTSEVRKYLASRKSLRKSLEKVMKGLKATENQSSKDGALAVLEEAEAVTVSAFDTLLRFISSSKSGKWSLVSRLMKQRRVSSCEGEAIEANEFEQVDKAFTMFVEKKSKQSLKVEDVQSLEMSIQDLEEGLETLFKSMIRVRASVLNM
ncbi:PREDICTED: uncharacterized protein LOC104819668 [Tarenaya hassleriana]|uniref:uncharacterized protein LOC104819668 n=1 Tax=Tarenaya hassleriana TaxID=28532 RepID=UPI00053C0B3A|nr:PREDICTED: uncharacterized protein LOC104819668 [Tarenaya hassleriana]